MASPRDREIGFVSSSFSFRVVRCECDAKLCVGVSETILLSLALLGGSKVRVSRRLVRFFNGRARGF